MRLVRDQAVEAYNGTSKSVERLNEVRALYEEKDIGCDALREMLKEEWTMMLWAWFG